MAVSPPNHFRPVCMLLDAERTISIGMIVSIGIKRTILARFSHQADPITRESGSVLIGWAAKNGLGTEQPILVYSVLNHTRIRKGE